MAELRLECGDVLECLRSYPDNHFDACLTDPPYGWQFMDKRWDYDIPSVEVWAELLRVLKPGAYALIACGTRTQHRMVVNVEDAGFTVRDVICWLHGQGFPKSTSVSAQIDKALGAEREVVGSAKGAVNPKGFKNPGNAEYKRSVQSGGAFQSEYNVTAPATPEAQKWDGYGTALKPSVEFFTLVQKPLSGTYAQNALEWGVGGLNVDGSRVGTEVRFNGPAKPAKGTFNASFANSHKGEEVSGRWPANLLLDGSPEVLEHFPQTSSGTRKSGTYRGMGYHGADEREYPNIEGNDGSAARFFKTCPLDGPEPQPRVKYSGKASKRERNAGLEEPNTHPTLKPLSLTEYLARLILPPERDTPRRLINPYSGSGSEAIGAFHADWDEVVSIEREEEYVEIARARVSHHCGLYVDIKD